MGVLRVELLDGKDIHGADRSGKMQSCCLGDHTRLTKHLRRKIGSFCRLHVERGESVQVTAQEENAYSCVEREL
jgi:hypothetical protein